jgi:hypothetical protein
MRRLFLLILVVAALAPTAAHAQSNPFGPLPPSQQATPEPTATPVPADQNSVSRPLLLGIAGAVALVFFAIGLFITRDARSHLTDSDRRAVEGQRAANAARAEEEKMRTKTAKSKARAADKRQRQARKAQRRR